MWATGLTQAKYSCVCDECKASVAPATKRFMCALCPSYATAARLAPGRATRAERNAQASVPRAVCAVAGAAGTN
ncbi:hypothetical protein DIPPA_24521 [Diplonema papillatum]|nr:hypothetical protein DIPPA_24521 [Diplonema papillatum]